MCTRSDRVLCSGKTQEIKQLQEKLQAAQYALRMGQISPAQPLAAAVQQQPPARTSSDFTGALAAAASNGSAPSLPVAEAGARQGRPSIGDGKAGLAMQAYYRQPALRVRFSAAQFAMLTGKMLRPPGAVLADLRT